MGIIGSEFGDIIKRSKQEARRRKLDEAQAERQYEYQTYYQPEVEKLAQLGQSRAGDVLEREMAKLRMRMGYNQYAGAGTGGWWNLARGAMETAGMQKGMELADQWTQWQTDQYIKYMKLKDQQAHELQMAAFAYQQQMELMKQQAELNDPSWWQTFGSIVGMSAAFLPGLGQVMGLPTYGLTDVGRALAFQF